MERNYTRTLQLLHHNLQPREYSDLLDTSEALITHAALQSTAFDSEGVSRLKTFADTPQISQAIWEGYEGINKYYHDTLGVHFIRDALVIGLHSRNPSEPNRNIVIGEHYARYSEYVPTRAQVYERGLDSEHIARFTEQFDIITARLGLARVTRAAREHQLATISEQAA